MLGRGARVTSRADPTGRGHARSMLRRRRRRDIRAAAFSAACVASVAWLVRQCGLPEAVTGALLGLFLGGIAAALFAALARRGGASSPHAVAGAVALFAATIGPMMSSIHPGPVLARAELEREGEIRDLGVVLRGDVSVAVSADLPREGTLAFSLAIGPGILEGELHRGILRWRAGEGRGHHHEDRAAVLLHARLASDVRSLALHRAAGERVPLRVTVYATLLPRWLVGAVSFALFLYLVWSASALRGSRELVGVASVGLTVGSCAGAIGSPGHAVGAVLTSLLLGTLAGVPLAAVTAWALRWLQVRRRWGASHRGP